MADSKTIKLKRDRCRNSVSRTLKAFRYTSDNLSAIKGTQLKDKIKIVKEEIVHQNDAHSDYISAMAAEGLDETVISGEEKGNESLSDTYDDQLNKLENFLDLSKLFSKDKKIQRSANMWIESSTIDSPYFYSEGKEQQGNLEELIAALNDYTTHPYFNNQIVSAEKVLKDV